MTSSFCSRRWGSYVMLLLAGALVEESSGADSDGTGLESQVWIVPVGRGYALSHINATSFNRYNLLSVGKWQFVAFTTIGRRQPVSRRRIDETKWQVFSTSFTANYIKDAHDVISIVVDGQGRLHVSWGIHGDAFHYAHSIGPVTGDAPIVFGPDSKMTGQEDHVTYPEFCHLPDGGLLYMFREGLSGSGDTYLSRHDRANGTWAPFHAAGGNHSPFIKGRGWTPDSNAYPNNLILDGQRRLHLVWTWRYNNDSPARPRGYQTNHNLMYARSADFGRTWTRIDGRPYVLPISESRPGSDPASVAEVALSIPEGSGPER